MAEDAEEPAVRRQGDSRELSTEEAAMRPSSRAFRLSAVPIVVLCALLFAGPDAHAQTDPLPSWNDGPAKKAIVEFVQITTDKASPKFVAPEARVATFDQDGTLRSEERRVGKSVERA